MLSLEIIPENIVWQLLISELGGSESISFCSEYISDNDFGCSFYAVVCDQVATRETMYARPLSVSATKTSSVHIFVLSKFKPPCG
jgi:hypothetical protein